MKVSVIIPTYNRKDLLPRAVDSVLSQTYRDLELIIVDDGSTDGTDELVGSYTDERVRYIRLPKNRGAAGARNAGIEAAAGEYIAFQDSDDEWYPQKLQYQVDCMDQSGEDVAIVFCRYMYINESQGLKGICPSENVTGEDVIFSNLLIKNHIGAPAMLVRKRCLEEIGGFDESLGCLEDYDLVLALTERYSAVMVDQVLVNAYGYENGVSGNVINYFNARIALFERYRQQMLYYGSLDIVRKDILRRASDCGLGDAVGEKLEDILNARPICDKKVSVVVPCYNSVEYLPDCLSSLEYQTIGMDALEIILVNDASTDNTLELLLEFEQKYPDSVIVVNLPENMRQGGARNAGISYASGEYLAFFDSDDTLPPNAYERLYEIAGRYDTDIIQFNNSDTVSVKDEALYYIETAGERSLLVSGGVLTFGCLNKFYRMGLVKDVASKFAEHMIFEEPPFVYPLFFYAKRIYMLPEDMYIYRHHEGSTMSAAARGKNRIQEHPDAQMQLLRDLIARKWIFDAFYREVSAYFIWSYYVETIIIAGQGGLSIDVDYFAGMQKIVNSVFPDYRDNDLICFEGSEYFPALSSLDKKFTQKQLDAFCLECANKRVLSLGAEDKNDIKARKTVMFLDWPCFMKEGAISAFKKLGYSVTYFFHEDYQSIESDGFRAKFADTVRLTGPDVCFSYNYYPMMAKCCYEAGLVYVSVVYDSPYLLIYSDTLGYETNRVFLFDRAWVREFQDRGFTNVQYSVLPGDGTRIEGLLGGAYDISRTSCDISFVGNIYNEQYNYYDLMEKNADPYLKGYLKGLMAAQHHVYGASIIEDLISDEVLKAMEQAFRLEEEIGIIEPKGYRYIDYIIKRKLTQTERTEYLQRIGEFASEKGYDAKLFTVNDKVFFPGISNMGVAPYEDEMNRVFHDSRINLNISLRSIKTGIPLRCIDIMSAGGFLLSNYQEDLCVDFVPGEDFDFYGDADEMFTKAEYYLTHEKERAQIAENGRRKIISNYSFERIFREIMES